MHYCFVEEDLVGLRDDDQLIIQTQYAKYLGLYCCCRLSKGTIIDHEKRPIRLDRKRVLLRATCSTMLQAASLLQDYGAELFETINDIHAIERWDSLPLAKRRILSVRFEDIFNTSFSPQVAAFILSTPLLFVKSREKGFCVQFPSRRLLQQDAEISAFFKAHCSHISDELLLSEVLGVKADSLGLKESRHFVFDNTIANSSRTLHSVKHAVPRTLLENATRLVETISAQKGFPRNYVIDVGEFERDGKTFFDIIELNPITCSLCYVNNSVFNKVVPEAAAFKRKTGMGAEYCYDAIRHPGRYTQSRHSCTCYTYTSNEHFSFS